MNISDNNQTDNPKKPRKNAVPHEIIEKILYYAHVLDLTDTEIGRKLKKDNTTIGKIRQRAEKEYLVKLINIPGDREKENNLENLLDLEKAVLVSCGHGKNSDHLGYAASRYLCEIIAEKFKTQDVVNIGVSCGSSIRTTCKRFVERLQDNNISFAEKTINIYPSALIGGNSFTIISPSFVASLLANKLLSLPSELRPKVNSYRSIIPASFYSEDVTDAEKKVIKKFYGYKTVLPDPVKTLDIVLTGIGRVVDDEYLLACKLTGVNIEIDEQIAEQTPEVNFSPFNANGVFEQYTGLIEGIRLNQMREMKGMDGKYVIALIGGEEKAKIAKTAFSDPYFNVLFTDTHVADPWLRTKKKKG